MVVLRGERVLLRPGCPEDAEKLVRIRKEPEVALRWGGDDIEEEIGEEFIGTEGFVIEVDGDVVGAIQYGEEDDPMYRHANVDIFLATSHHGQGLGAEAIRLLARHLFEERGHHRLTIDPAADNAAAIRAYEKVGFRPVGIMRNYERGPEGAWHDGLLMDLLREEFRPAVLTTSAREEVRHMGVQSFDVSVSQETLDDLRERLRRTRYPDEVEGAGWDYGANLAYLKELADYWRDGFDWRKQEAELNRFAHFRVDVGGFGVHFVHERGEGPNPLPIVLTHGWPDSFYRFHKIIPMLTDPARYGGDPADSFDVVVPSLPGYGFSDRPTERGMTRARVARLWGRLMTEVLGHQRFAAHGGDVGGDVTQLLALDRPDSLVGIHLTGVPYSNIAAFAGDASDLSAAERDYVERGKRFVQQEGAYAAIQSTKPQTLAYGLNDSPAGLAAWIVEKFRAWSDCDGDVEKRFSKDELLTNLTIYWATQTIHSSARIYYENAHDPQPAGSPAGSWVGVPTGFAIFPKDIVPAPRDWAERFFDVRRWTQMPKGGHFTAMEEPELLAEDIRAFFRPLR